MSILLELIRAGLFSGSVLIFFRGGRGRMARVGIRRG